MMTGRNCHDDRSKFQGGKWRFLQPQVENFMMTGQDFIINSSDICNDGRCRFYDGGSRFSFLQEEIFMMTGQDFRDSRS